MDPALRDCDVVSVLRNAYVEMRHVVYVCIHMCIICECWYVTYLSKHVCNINMFV